jgi:hypothetical protein
MIDFIGETIKRAALSVRHPRSAEPPSGMAVQSLNMALSILSLHLTQKSVQVINNNRKSYLPRSELSCHFPFCILCQTFPIFPSRKVLTDENILLIVRIPSE